MSQKTKKLNTSRKNTPSPDKITATNAAKKKEAAFATTATAGAATEKNSSPNKSGKQIPEVAKPKPEIGPSAEQAVAEADDDVIKNTDTETTEVEDLVSPKTAEFFQHDVINKPENQTDKARSDKGDSDKADDVTDISTARTELEAEVTQQSQDALDPPVVSIPVPTSPRAHQPEVQIFSNDQPVDDVKVFPEDIVNMEDEEDLPRFRIFTPDSYIRLCQREEEERRKEAERRDQPTEGRLVDGELIFNEEDEGEKIENDPDLLEGNALPTHLAEVFPKELFSQPIEEIDEYIKDKVGKQCYLPR